MPMQSKLVASALLMAITMLFISAPAFASEEKADICVEAALDTGDTTVKKGLKIFGHDFNCHTVRRVSVDYADNDRRASTSERIGTWVYTWRLSHALRFRKDDQVDWRFEIRKFERRNRRATDPSFECLTIATRQLNRGGFAPIPGAVGRLIGQNDWEEQWRRAARDFDSRTNPWEKVSDLLGARIAASLERRVGCDHRKPERTYQGTSVPPNSSSRSGSDDSKAETPDGQVRVGRRTTTTQDGRTLGRPPLSTSTPSDSGSNAIMGTSWVIDLNRSDITTSSTNKRWIISFGNEGQMTVALACSTWSGRWSLGANSRVNAGSAQATLRRSRQTRCTDLAQDQRIAADLQNIERWRVNGDRSQLSLRTKHDGQTRRYLLRQVGSRAVIQ